MPVWGGTSLGWGLARIDLGKGGGRLLSGYTGLSRIFGRFPQRGVSASECTNQLRSGGCVTTRLARWLASIYRRFLFVFLVLLVLSAFLQLPEPQAAMIKAANVAEQAVRQAVPWPLPRGKSLSQAQTRSSPCADWGPRNGQVEECWQCHQTPDLRNADPKSNDWSSRCQGMS